MESYNLNRNSTSRLLYTLFLRLVWNDEQIMKNIFLYLLPIILYLLSSTVFSYTPSSDTLHLAEKLQGQLTHLFSRMSSSEQKMALVKIDARVTLLQNNLIGLTDTKSLERLSLIQYLARRIPGVWSFDTKDVIYDELASVIWTHASKWFDILYRPYETPSVQQSDPDKKYRTLLNGGYFNRVDGSLYHAGMLSLNGERQTPWSFDDPQITHFVCVDSRGMVTFIPNAFFLDSLLQTCAKLFQWGPLLYARNSDTIQEDLRPNSYIGRAHKRTVMVVFDTKISLSAGADIPLQEEGKKQDVWFLTVNEEVTLAEVRNIVLREVRFIGEYDSISILNLDGGSSVAHVNYSYPELNIGRTKKLPIVFGIK